jgi:hypothetical protein
MRALRQPQFNVRQVVELCVTNIADQSLVRRLLDTIPFLEAGEANYRASALGSALFAIVETQHVGGLVDADDLRNLYARKLASQEGPGRPIYDAIKLGAQGNICPLCNQRTVSTLDHYLAKASHPVFSVAPLNLVPACKDCNLDTQQRRPRSAGEQTLHPYFDTVDNSTWLFASVIEASPPAIAFRAEPSEIFPAPKREMIRAHFEAFSLRQLYTTHAAVELVNVYHDITTMPEIEREQAIRAEFRQRAINRRHVVRNSWQAAMYDALADSDWFCAGGYRSIVM